MPARSVACPTAVASQRSGPCSFTVPASTGSPGRFGTGWLSPVSIDSLTADSPLSTRPSTGTVAPARTMNTSPACTCESGTSLTSPSRSRSTVGGCSESRWRIAFAVRAFARPSSSLPSSTSVMTTAAASKYTCWLSSAFSRLGLWRGGGGGVRARRRGFGSPSSPLILGERSCAFAGSAIGLNRKSLAHTKECESSENPSQSPLPGAPDDGAWGSSPGDRAGPPLPGRAGTQGEILSSLYVEGSPDRKHTRHGRCIQVRAAEKRNTLLLCFGRSVYEGATK